MLTTMLGHTRRTLFRGQSVLLVAIVLFGVQCSSSEQTPGANVAGTDAGADAEVDRDDSSTSPDANVVRPEENWTRKGGSLSVDLQGWTNNPDIVSDAGGRIYAATRIGPLPDNVPGTAGQKLTYDSNRDLLLFHNGVDIHRLQAFQYVP